MDFIFNVMFIVIPILVLCGFIFTFLMMFSPKFRGKFMVHQLKSTKYMLDESKDDLTNMATMAGNMGVQIRKNIMDENEDVLKDLSKREAEIAKDKIEITARAIKDGLSGRQIYCKHCGALIDEDSKFCKKCGKKL